jgi:TolB-like protein/Tfp pilus assembly protein PilF
MIRFRLLGSVDLRDEDGNEVRGVLAQPKRLALLGYLCITSRTGPARRDTVLGLFWPELDQTRARNALNKAIHFLRRALGDDVLVSRSSDDLVVDSDKFWCDVTAFDGAVTAQQHAYAVDLYRGQLLSGLFVENSHDFEEWLYHERVRLRTLAAQAAHILAVQAEKDNDVTMAVMNARRAVEWSDSDERLVRHLIELLNRFDDRIGAMDAYQNFARRLERQFQTQPSDRTLSLIERMRSGKRVSTSPNAIVIDSLVVLPLDNITGDAAHNYFVDGMHDALIAQLAQVYKGRLISRTSAMHYKGTTKSVPQIARELDVDAVVEGSVLRSENTVRIQVQLIQVEPERHVWSETYTRDLVDVLTLHREIARNVASQIISSLDDYPREGATLTGVTRGVYSRVRGLLVGNEKDGIASSEFDADEDSFKIQKPGRQALDPRAYDEYLLGRHFLASAPSTLDIAIQHFENSIARDSDFAPAYAGLAQSALWLAWTGRPDLLKKGHGAARKAVDLDNRLPEAHTVLAMSRLSDWNWTGADEAFRWALQMDPNSVLAHEWYGQLLRVTLRLDQALVEARQAADLDPHSLTLRTMVGWVYHDQRRHDEALAVYASVLKIQPDFGLAIYNEGLSYWMKGLAQSVVERALHAKDVGFNEVYADWLLSIGRALSGDRSAALAVLDELQSRHPYIPHTLCAAVYDVLRDDDMAFQLLERALAMREPMLPSLTSEPLFDRLSAHPRFHALRASMRLHVSSPAPR